MAIGAPLGVGAEGSGKFGVASALKLPGSPCSTGSGAAVGVGGHFAVFLIVNQVSMALAELKGDMPVASNPDRPASSAILFWPHGMQVKTGNVHITDVRCCI
jgi:hypothetical protein